METKEKLSEELARLVREYDAASLSEKVEAWNLIADFAVENHMEIEAALRTDNK